METLAASVATPPRPSGTLDAARRWFGTGRSSDSDVSHAARQATSAALQSRRPSLLVVFCTPWIDFEVMLAGVRAEAGDVPLIGCCGLAPFAGPDGGEGTVVVSALGGPGFEIRTSVATNVSAQRRAAGELVGETAEALTSQHKLLLMLCDGLAGDQHEVVRGAYSIIGAAVPMAGGCAADDFTYQKTFQFYSDDDGMHVVTDAVVAAAIGSDAPIGVGTAHGWRKVGEPMVVTSSDGGHVRTLDGEPALDVFLERVGSPRSITEDPEKFTPFAMQHPLGMSRRSGEDIRVIHGGNVADGSIVCLADVPQGALLWMMESRPEDLIGSVGDAYDESVGQLGGVPPLGFLAFDCGVRHLMLGADGLRQESDGFLRRADGTPFSGLYTYGEFARTRGARGMHHLTLVIVAFS